MPKFKINPIAFAVVSALFVSAFQIYMLLSQMHTDDYFRFHVGAGTATPFVLRDCGVDCSGGGEIADAPDAPDAHDADASIADGVDCRSFLEDYRNGKIDEIERDPRWSKSFVTRTVTPNPFYWSTHHPELDPVRKVSFDEGRYYELELSNRIIEAFDNVKIGSEKGNTSSIFLDVGGNIGWFSLLAAAHGATRVYTFEPNPANVVRICESLSMNNWLPNDRRKDFFTPILKGVGSVSGIQQFYRRELNYPGSNTFHPPDARKSHYNPMGEIEIVTLDSFAETHGWFDERPNIAFFKLDVEGYELQVIEGAQKLFKSRLVELFAIEMQMEKESVQIYKILDIVFNSGYELYMEGNYKGPDKKVDVKYTSHEELAKDIVAKKYKENLLFRRNANFSVSPRN